MGEIYIKGWETLQSYKDRRPLWIRLHKSLLDDFEFHSMSVNARAMLPMLWLLASEDKDPKSGRIQFNLDKIAFRIRVDKDSLLNAIRECQDAGFIECNGSVTELLQQQANSVTTEKRREEKRRENEQSENVALAETPQPDEVGQAPKYAFAGEVVKMTRADLRKWEDKFTAINVIEHLKGIDKTYAARKGTDEEAKNKNWFWSAFAALAKADNEKRLQRPQGEAWI